MVRTDCKYARAEVINAREGENPAEYLGEVQPGFI